jgi:FKBP-type peptidyl-prolyl cis-trans isomerase FklB
MTMPSITARPASIHSVRRALSRGVGLIALAAMCNAPAAANAQAPDATVLQLKTLKDKNSYATGVMTARNLVRNEVDFDLDLLVRGLRDGMADGEIAMSEKELKIVLQSMQAEMQRHLTNERQVKASVNREKGVIFQNEFKKQPGVVVLPGNLMYRVVKSGNGDRPGELGSVVVRFKGKRIDGTELEATPEGKTVTLKLEEVMTGWRETLKRMNAGSTWEVVIPPTMAYGPRGTPTIGPNETLVFDLELVAVVQPH